MIEDKDIDAETGVAGTSVLAAPAGTASSVAPSEGERILVLWSSDASLRSPVVSWARYGPEDLDLTWLVEHQAGSTLEPPYASVVAALADGWRLLQLDGPPVFTAGEELRAGHLPYQAVLSRSRP